MQRSALCRSRRELSNAYYFLAKFGFDTAENEPRQAAPPAAERARLRPGDAVRVRPAHRATAAFELLRSSNWIAFAELGSIWHNRTQIVGLLIRQIESVSQDVLWKEATAARNESFFILSIKQI